MAEDNYNNFWVGSQTGLCIFNNKGSKFFPEEKFQDEDIHQIKNLTQNQMMVVSNSGIYILACNSDPDLIRVLSQRLIMGTNCAVNTGVNEYLIGTNNGLYYLQGKNKKLMTIQDGLLSENINDIYFDHEHDLAWIGTPEGLMQIDVGILRKEVELPLEITQLLLIRNQGTKMPDTSNVFEYSENEFSISFHAFNYNNPTKIRYQYKTDDGVWIPAPSNEIQFASLSPGNHTIYLRAGLSDGAWGPSKTVSITVLPPFYMTWWFYLMEGVLGTTMLTLAIWYKIKQLRIKQEKEIEMKRKMVELQQKALANNLNPHFVFNSLNAIQHFINCKDASEANVYLAKFARLMRMHLHNADHNTIILDAEIQRLEFYLTLEQLRFANKLKWKIDIDPRLNPSNLIIPNMIIQPFIENSLWHGIMPANYIGEVHLSIMSGPDESIIVTITDNGVGLNYKKNIRMRNENSRGTRFIQERLNLLDPGNEEVLSFEELNPGTRVKVIFSSKVYRKIALGEPVMK